MAFSTGSVTSLANFITALGDFAIAQAGFTRTIYTDINFDSSLSFANNTTWNDSSEIPATDFTVTILSKAGSNVHWTFINDDSGVLRTSAGGAPSGLGDYYFPCFMTYSNTGITSSTSYTSDVVLKTNLGGGQEDASGFNTYKDAITNSNYWFYTNGDEIHAVLEVKNNIFNHFSFGTIVKYDSSWVGGEYMTCGFVVDRQGGAENNRYEAGGTQQHYPFQEYGQTANAYCYLYNQQITPVDSTNFSRIGHVSVRDNQQCLMGIDVDIIDNVPAEGDFTGFLSELLLNANNTFNLRAPLLPIYVRTRDVASTSLSSSSRGNVYNLVGEFERVRLVNMTNLTPKSLVDTDWRVFPLAQKAGGDDTQSPLTNFYGLAYREI